MIEQQKCRDRLINEIHNLTGNIGFKEIPGKTEGIMFTFSSKVYKNIKNLPIIAVRDILYIDEFAANFDIYKEKEDLIDEVITLMDFYNERQLFFTNVDKQIVKDEISQAISELYKGIMNYCNSLNIKG